jgi:hypothetical protein
VLEDSELEHVKDRINDSTARKLVDTVIALDGVSRGAERPELDDDVGEQLSDCNPPLPCLLAVFADGDAISGCFDEEAQGMMEVEPEPNIIIPFDPIDNRRREGSPREANGEIAQRLHLPGSTSQNQAFGSEPYYLPQEGARKDHQRLLPQ